MAWKSKKELKEALQRNWTWPSVILGLFVAAVLIGLPIVYDNYYFNILDTKYYYYCGCVITMLVLLAVYAFFTAKPKTVLGSYKGKRLFELFGITDLAVLAFALVGMISTLTSPYRYEAFWGNEGRFSGLFLIFCIRPLILRLPGFSGSAAFI